MNLPFENRPGALITKREEVDHLIEARRHLCAVRDGLPELHQASRQANEVVAKVEAMLGY